MIRIVIHWAHPAKTLASYRRYSCRIGTREELAHSASQSHSPHGGVNARSHGNAVPPGINGRAGFRSLDRHGDVTRYTIGICRSRIHRTPLQARAPLYAGTGTRLRPSRDQGCVEASPAGRPPTTARHCLARIPWRQPMNCIHCDFTFFTGDRSIITSVLRCAGRSPRETHLGGSCQMVSARSLRLLSPLLLLGILDLPGRAVAHDAPTGWKYPWACCSNMDCKEISRRSYLKSPKATSFNSLARSWATRTSG